MKFKLEQNFNINITHVVYDSLTCKKLKKYFILIRKNEVHYVSAFKSVSPKEIYFFVRK